jgi:hypothetical protein
MLMRRMTRFKLGLLLALAALIASEPIIHNHPLIPDGNAAVQMLCAVCASGADRVTMSAPEVAAPTVIAYALEPRDVTFAAPLHASSLSSRAPPAA